MAMAGGLLLAIRPPFPQSGPKTALHLLAASPASSPLDGGAGVIIEPGFVRTELLEKQIPEQAKALGISENEVVKKLFLADTVDGCFTTVEEVAEAAVFFASYPTCALTGQSLAVSHGIGMH